MAENNIAALFAVFGLAALGGSVVTALLVMTAGWALIYLLIGRLPLRRDPQLLIFSAVLLLYIGTNALFFLLHFGKNFDSQLAEFRKFAPQLLFLAPIFLLQRLAVSRREDLLLTLSRAAAIGALLVLPLALYESFVLHTRAEGGGGNAIPFALICALLSMLSLPCLLDADRRWRLVGALGFVAGYLCVFLSQTKGLMPAPLVAALVFGVFLLSKRASRAECLGAVGVVFAVALIGFYVSGSDSRFDEVSDLVSGSKEVVWSASYTVRLDLWTKAFDLIQSGLLNGHGLQNRRALITAAGYSYSHFHNGFLTALVDNGILGLVVLVTLLVSPFVIALRAPRDALYGPRLFIAFCLVQTYAIGGMTNFIFGHDIYDAVFLWIATVIVASTLGSNKSVVSVDATGDRQRKVGIEG
ncbi:hypothetical protein ASE36_03680 [Rhizobium sp. Root274]|nr:hypothetical protein ASC71_03680 [Rhizobium sp. Root1240]KRD32912.1 hypothetical protein ASE36_03680 [Rhizobium sp. Root274]